MITKLTDQRVSFDNGDVVLSYQSPQQTRFPKLHEVDLTGLVSPVRLKLPNHMVNTPDLPPPCNCSEMRWHPYPEEKPEEEGSYWITYLSGEGKTVVLAGYDFEEGFGRKYCNDVIAWAPYFEPSPYIPPPKKKTVRVSRQSIRSAIEGYCFQFDKQGHLTVSDLPDFIEIEVSDDAI